MKRTKLTAPLGVLVFLFCMASASAATLAGGALTRIQTLSDLGLSAHISLNSRNFEQHFYFPVPQDAVLDDSNFEIHGVYQHPFPEAAAITLLVNGRPVYTQRMPDIDGKLPFSATKTGNAAFSIRHLDGQGDEISISLSLHGLHTQDGFIDMGVVLSSQVDATRCIDERGRGNELSIDPKTTQLRYSFDAASVRDIRSLLTTLPQRPVILLPQNKLTALQYTTALRLSQALSSMGLLPEFAAVPQVGDEIDTGSLSGAIRPEGMHIPPEMATAIAQGKSYRISGPEEIGIWLALRMMSVNGLAQAVIDPAQTRKALLEAVHGTAPAALGGRVWAELGLDKADGWLGNATLDKANIRMSMLANQPVLALEGGKWGKA